MLPNYQSNPILGSTGGIIGTRGVLHSTEDGSLQRKSISVLRLVISELFKMQDCTYDNDAY